MMERSVMKDNKKLLDRSCDGQEHNLQFCGSQFPKKKWRKRNRKWRPWKSFSRRPKLNLPCFGERQQNVKAVDRPLIYENIYISIYSHFSKNNIGGFVFRIASSDIQSIAILIKDKYNKEIKYILKIRFEWYSVAYVSLT